MPKIIDHKKYRKGLVKKATLVFREYGYSGLGMRKIAEELGISKSALYHYFSSKESLFEGCTKAVTSFENRDYHDSPIHKMNTQERIKALIKIFKRIEKDFKGELSLLIDYTRSMTPAQVAVNKNMQLANQNYITMIASFVGQENAEFVLCIMYGVLLQRLLAGRKYGFQEIEEKLISFLKTANNIDTQ